MEDPQALRPSRLPTGQFSLRSAVLERNTLLTAPAPETRRECRERENIAAIGGMRNPSVSVQKLPGLCVMGARLSSIIDDAFAQFPSLLDTLGFIRLGEPKEFDPDVILNLRTMIATEFGADFPESEASPISARMFHLVAEFSDDPDAATLAHWLEAGAPIGILHQIETNGIFPPVEGELQPSCSLSWLFTLRGEEASHKSAEEDPGTTEALIAEACDKGFAKVFQSRKALEEYLGT